MKITFTEEGDFEAMYAAEVYLRTKGFSVGANCRGEPRGILKGDHWIEKWRNLDDAERQSMDGIMTGDMRRGPVTVEIYDKA